MLSARIESLERKHKILHDTVEALEAERAPDEIVSKMKIEKLHIKDEIAKLKEQLR